METLKKYWGYILATLGAVFGLLVFFMGRRGDKINSLKAEIALANTEKQADVLEAQIKDLKTNKDNLAKETQELDKTLKEIDNRRVEIKEEAKNLKDPKAIASYWEHN